MDNLKKYFNFDGTATRSEYWGVYLVTMGLMFPVMFVAGLLSMFGLFGILLGTALLVFVTVAFVIVYATTSVKRCRDAGISPWFSLSLLIPTVNIVCWIVYGCLPSEDKND